MKYLITAILLVATMDSQTIFDFHTEADIKYWRIVDDVVMGGRSSGTFKLDDQGLGIFEGNVSLENNGGFSSVRYRFQRMNVEGFSKVKIKLLGDGKSYQFRIKTNARDYYSYITTFTTSGEWEEIEIPLTDMYPSFRGRRLNFPNFSSESIEEIAFLIANKKPEKFKLAIDKISLE
ncbi:MAG: CIA30 family protein [Bacteroidota bacterium]